MFSLLLFTCVTNQLKHQGKGKLRSEIFHFFRSLHHFKTFRPLQPYELFFSTLQYLFEINYHVNTVKISLHVPTPAKVEVNESNFAGFFFWIQTLEGHSEVKSTLCLLLERKEILLLETKTLQNQSSFENGIYVCSKMAINVRPEGNLPKSE